MRATFIFCCLLQASALRFNKHPEISAIKELDTTEVSNGWTGYDTMDESMKKQVQYDETEELDLSRAPPHVQLRRNVKSITDDFVKTYAAQYANEMHRRSAVFFLHVSKSAGTTICDCGKHNGCNAPNRNCHTKVDWHLWGGNHIGNTRQNLTCQELADLNKQMKWTLEGDENYLPAEGTCPQFWNVIVLRNPINRIISHAHEMSRDKTMDFEAMNRGGWSILTHNYYIRSLVGEFDPEVKITEEHLRKAKQILNTFDVVLIKNPSLNNNLDLTLGWKCPNAQSRGHSGRYEDPMTTEEFGEMLKQKWGEDKFNLLYEQNKLDFMLKAHADRLAAHDERIFNHPQFQLTKPGKCGYLDQ